MHIRNAVLGATAVLASPWVMGGYGPNVISHGGEGHAMGSADLARSHSGIGSNINPAGMSQIDKGNFSAYGELFYLDNFLHSDSLGNDARVDPDYTSVFGAGYATRLESMDSIVLGLAFVAQGGVGYQYPSLKVANGETDNLEALFGVFRVAPSVAWQASDKLSIGLSLGINYVEGSQDVFNDISIAPEGNDPGFPGLKVDGMSGFDLTYKVGLQYQLNEAWTLALVYSSATDLILEGGDATVNFEAFGLGRVDYADAEVKGLTLAEELGVGFNWKINGSWELAAELNWLNWSAAMESSTLILTRPDDANAPARIASTTALEWRDQYVLGLGVIHHWKDGVDLMAGYTYGRNPVPSKNASPIFNVYMQHHLTAGIAWQLDAKWRGIFTFFYSPPESLQYSNNGLPLGERSRERAGGIDITLTFERRW